MASITPISALRNSAANALTFTALGTGLSYTPASNDVQTVYIVTNAGSVTRNLTITKGGGYNAAASDMAVAITAGQTLMFTLDSSRYIQHTGTNKGLILFSADSGTDVKMAVVNLA